ncbi:NUDIX hydrolase [uncultured Clostridium sp.]|uniref:NUDIX hydrolase n=1 Tax=uncultured Clostridium sp. TaxID=59620 RepID=UPI002635D591|nr:NUDIX hydrolase [uncultured Clostridium sp.]
MKLIKEIFNECIGLSSNKKDRVYNLARSSRAVVFNGDRVALLNVKNEGYHKLPGGKIDKDETREEAVIREVSEEIGYKMNITEELGLIIEYSDDTSFMQLSFAYKGIILEKSNINLSENEINQGIEVEWYYIDEAIKILREEKPDSYHGKFIVNRDLSFLEEALK